MRVLYLSESRGMSVNDAFAEMESVDDDITRVGDGEEGWLLKPFALGLGEDQKEYTLNLAREIEKNAETLNDYIKPVLRNWDFNRISRIDRIILWIALAEMSTMLDIPVSVSINEAIELAKKYSSNKSPAFINGILDAAAKNILSQ